MEKTDFIPCPKCGSDKYFYRYMGEGYGKARIGCQGCGHLGEIGDGGFEARDKWNEQVVR